MSFNQPRSEILLQNVDDDERAVFSGRLPFDPTLIADAYNNDDFWTGGSRDLPSDHDRKNDLNEPFDIEVYRPLLLVAGVRIPPQSRKRVWQQTGLPNPCHELKVHRCQKPTARDPVPAVVHRVNQVPRRVSICDNGSVTTRETKAAQGALSTSNQGNSLLSYPTLAATCRPQSETPNEVTVQVSNGPLPKPPKSPCQFFVRHKLVRLRQQGFAITKDSLRIPVSIATSGDFHQWRLTRSIESLGWHIRDPSTLLSERPPLLSSIEMPHFAANVKPNDCATGSRRPCSSPNPRLDPMGVAGLVQYLTECWEVLPDSAKAVFREISAQDVLRYRQEVVERTRTRKL